jgi:hypothetical protein
MDLTEEQIKKITVIGFLTIHPDINKHRLLSKYNVSSENILFFLKNGLCQNTTKTDIENSRITILGWEHIDGIFYDVLINKYSNKLKETKKVHDTQYETLIVLTVGISLIINIIMMYFIGHVFNNIMFYRYFNISIIFLQLLILSHVIPENKFSYENYLEYIALKRFCYLSCISIFVFIICFFLSLLSH